MFFPQINVLGYNVFYKKQNKERWVVKFADRSTFLVLKNLSFDTTYYVRVNVRYEDDVRAKLSRTAVIKTFSLGWCALLTKFNLYKDTEDKMLLFRSKFEILYVYMCANLKN